MPRQAARETEEWDVAGFRQRISLLKNQGARLVTVSGTPDTTGEVTLRYFFDIDAGFVAIVTRTSEASIDSLYSLFTGADIVEREINSLFGVKFVGNPNLPNAGGESI